MCYAPPRNFPQPYALPHAGLPWYGEEGVESIHNWIQAAMWRIQLHRDAVADAGWVVNVLPTEVWKCFAWLRGTNIQDWYDTLHRVQKRSFCMLVRHIALECGRISREDGCFIALNYAVRGSFCSMTILSNEVYSKINLDAVDTWPCSSLDGELLWANFLSAVLGLGTNLLTLLIPHPLFPLFPLVLQAGTGTDPS